MLPTPTMTPWPGIRRGTDWTVPMVPGFVMLTFAPWKSATVSLLPFTLRMRSSYATRNWPNVMVSAALSTGTTRLRVPSPLSTSTARPTFTWGLRTIWGLPSASAAYEFFMAGTASEIALTIA